MECSYCGERRAVNSDHVIPKSVRRRYNVHRKIEGRPRISPSLRMEATVPACFECNIRKGARLLIPPSWADRLDELNNLGIGLFRVWHGDAASLREVRK